MQVAMIGLGAMGAGMVRNLAKAGHLSQVWNASLPNSVWERMPVSSAYLKNSQLSC